MNKYISQEEDISKMEWNNLIQIRINGCNDLPNKNLYKHCSWLDKEYFMNWEQTRYRLFCKKHDRLFFHGPCIECVEEENIGIQEDYFYDNSFNS